MNSKILSVEDLVTGKEIAAALKINHVTLLHWAREYPDFPAVRLPGVNRYRISEVQRWIDNLPSRKLIYSKRKQKAALKEEKQLVTA